MITSSLWEFKIVNADGDVLANLTKAYKRTVKVGLNMAGEATFAYNVSDLHNLAVTIGQTVRSLLSVGINQLDCYRDGVLKFSGQISSAEYMVDDMTAIVEVKALGWFWLLGKRYTGLENDRIFSSTDAGTIAWTLIDEAQTALYGDIGITQGVIDTSINRDITYTRKNVKDAIEELAHTSSGFDFELTPAKVFNVHYPFKGSDKSNSVFFLYPGNEFISIEERTDATKIYNYVFAMGYGIGSDELTAESDDVTSQDTYIRRDYLMPSKDIQNATVLSDVADQFIYANKNLQSVYKLKMVGNSSQVESVAVGDYVRVNVKQDYYTIDRALRIFEIHFMIDEKDLETVDYILGLI